MQWCQDIKCDQKNRHVCPYSIEDYDGDTIDGHPIRMYFPSDRCPFASDEWKDLPRVDAWADAGAACDDIRDAAWENASKESEEGKK